MKSTPKIHKYSFRSLIEISPLLKSGDTYIIQMHKLQHHLYFYTESPLQVKYTEYPEDKFFLAMIHVELQKSENGQQRRVPWVERGEWGAGGSGKFIL